MRPAEILAQEAPGFSWSMVHVAPAPPLQPFIDCFVDYSETITAFTTRRELPHPRIVFIVNRGEPIAIGSADGGWKTVATGDGFVAGIHDIFAFSRSGGAQSGNHVWLTAPGARHFFGVGMDALKNNVVLLSELLGREGLELGERLGVAGSAEARFDVLDAFFLARLRSAKALSPEVAWSWSQIAGDTPCRIADLVRETGWSHRRLIARFREEIGVAPKLAARIHRFDRVIRNIEGAGWAALAIDAGYFDQPHLVRDFREFAGLTPSEYLARLRPDGGGLVEH